MSRVVTADERALWRAYTAGALGFLSPSPRPARPAAQPEKVLDLHGLILHDAYRATHEFLADSHHQGCRAVVIITGRSGRIRVEFPRWLELHRRVASCQETPRGGAFKVKLRRP